MLDFCIQPWHYCLTFHNFITCCSVAGWWCLTPNASYRSKLPAPWSHLWFLCVYDRELMQPINDRTESKSSKSRWNPINDTAENHLDEFLCGIYMLSSCLAGIPISSHSLKTSMLALSPVFEWHCGSCWWPVQGISLAPALGKDRTLLWPWLGIRGVSWKMVTLL